jgi:hypothetical protein
VARKIAAWVDRLGTVWVEGQLTQVSARAGTVRTGQGCSGEVGGPSLTGSGPW